MRAASRSCCARWRAGALPRQPERPPIVIGAEQHRPERRREKRAVDLQRDIVAGTFAEPMPVLPGLFG